MDAKKEDLTLPFGCPVCAKITDRKISDLKEGAILVCSFCNLKLNLHGHMLEAVNAQIAELTDQNS